MSEFPDQSVDMQAAQQQEALTHAAVLAQYAQNPDANPYLLGHMQNLAANEVAVPQPDIEVATEGTLGDFAANRDGHNPQPAEAVHARAEISPRHHQEHLEAASFVDGIESKSPEQQDLIGEVIEIGMVSTQESDAPSERSPLAAVADKLDDARTAYGLAKANYEPYSQELFAEMKTFQTALHDTVSVPSSELRGQLESPDCTPEDLSRLLGAAKDGAAMNDIDPQSGLAIGYREKRTSPMALIDAVPSELLRKSYFSATDKEGGTLRFLLSKEMGKDGAGITHEMAGQMARIYDVKGSLELMKLPEAATDPRLKTVIESGKLLLFAISEMTNRPKEGESLDAFNSTIRQQAAEVLKATGLPEGIANEFQRAIGERTMMKGEDGFSLRGSERRVDGMAMQRALDKAHHAVQEVGVDALTRLYDQCGIINFDNYEPAQLTRMVRYMEGDAGLMADIQQGDLTVVMADARGDHNGSMGSSAATFDTESQRALFFEINQPSDMYRQMITLNNNGLKPSTIVLSAHGAPGYMAFGNPNVHDGFTITNLAPDVIQDQRDRLGVPPTVHQGLQEAAGLKRIVADYMQDGKGIDGPPESAGRRRIILKSCSQAVQRDIKQGFEGSGIEDRLQSTAETLTKVADNQNLDVFAAPAITGTERTESGFAYTDGTPARSHRLDENGNVVTEDHEEVRLRAA